MTLARLLLGWTAVTTWFVVADWAARRLLHVPDAARARRITAAAAIEAGVVTLFASLWFDSLGHGGWWLLFALVGVLAAFPVRVRAILRGALPRHPELLLAVLDTARYVGAGALLAWKLR